MSFVMRYRWLFYVILWIFDLLKSGQIGDVCGMPLHQFSGGSNVCDLDFEEVSRVKQRSHIAYEVLFREKNVFIANSSYCDLEIWNGARTVNKQERNNHKLDVRLEMENPELYKIYLSKGDMARLPSGVNFVMQIVCPNRKFKDCIHFLKGKGALPMQRKLLTVDKLYMHRNTKDDLPFQPVILLVIGVVILVIGGSLCSDCDKNRDDESIAEARPQLMSIQGRASVNCNSAPPEEDFQEEIVESKDNVFVEAAEGIEDDAVDGRNHLSFYDEPTVTLKPVALESVENITQKSQEQGPMSVEDTQHVQSVVRPASVDHVTEGDQKNGKKKRGSKHEHEHEEHKGKFWKRSRSSQTTTQGPNEHRTSGVVFTDEEHKHDRRSRKVSKEQKTKSFKSNDRKGSTENEEKKTLNEHHHERPREATPTLQRHSRGLPAPPPPPGFSVSTLPDRPIPQRQTSAPDGTRLIEDDNYEMVEMRKVKSVGKINLIADDNYDIVLVEERKPRLPVSVYDSINVDESSSQRVSDIYEIVEGTEEPDDEDLYDEVEDDEGNANENKRALCDEEAEGDEDPEDPYSRIKKLKENEALEDLDLYEEIEKRQENGETNGVLDGKDLGAIRSRCKSDTTGLKRGENEIVKRSNTIDVVRTKEGQVTSTPLMDYLYAKVDLSKKTKRNPSDGDDTGEEVWTDNIPPPLPPAYLSSKQIQIEMWEREGTADSLYDEVGPGTTEQQQSPNLELSVPDYNTDETERLSNVSNDYELVQVKHTITTVDDSYSGLVDEGPRPKTDSCGRGGPELLVARRTPAGSPSDVSGSDGAQGDQDDNDEPHYELVAPRKASHKETVHSSSFGWV